MPSLLVGFQLPYEQCIQLFQRCYPDKAVDMHRHIENTLRFRNVTSKDIHIEIIEYIIDHEFFLEQGLELFYYSKDSELLAFGILVQDEINDVDIYTNETDISAAFERMRSFTTQLNINVQLGVLVVCDE